MVDINSFSLVEVRNRIERDHIGNIPQTCDSVGVLCAHGDYIMEVLEILLRRWREGDSVIE
jgi:hypothetical protein